MNRQYEDRAEAGRVLARYLMHYSHRPDVLVLALPRGGVPVAFEVATALDAPMDLAMVRKLGVPGQEELAMGAIAMGVRFMNEDVVNSLRITRDMIEEVARREQEELVRRLRDYRGDRPEPEVKGWTVILIDDGLATGASMKVAVRAVRQKLPAGVIVAVPVAPADTIESLQHEVDEIVCPMTPSPFFGVGQWYYDFSQTTDAQVRELLSQVRKTEYALPKY